MTAVLGSVFRRALRDRPGEVLARYHAEASHDPDSASVSHVLAALAALVAGEPRRASSILERAGPDTRTSPEAVAVRHAAACFDLNWWPGDTGAQLIADVPELQEPPVTTSGDLQTDFLLALIRQVQPELLSLRSIVRSTMRIRPDQGPEVVRHRTVRLQRALELASKRNEPVAATLAVELADLHRLAGARSDAEQYLAWAQKAFDTAKDPAGTGRCRLMEAEWLTTPSTFTETLAFDLDDLDAERRLPTPEAAAEARRSYREARRLFRAAGADRGIAATYLGEGCLAFLTGAPERAERLMRLAGRFSRLAGDLAAAHLADVHATLAAISAGRLSAAASDVATPIAHWALGPGSVGFGRGLARILHACGHAWWRADDVERARCALTLAVDLSTRLASAFGLPRTLSDLGELYDSIHSSGPAIASYQTALADRLGSIAGTPAGEEPEPMLWLEAASLAVSLFKVQLDERDPEGLERALAIAQSLTDRAPAGASTRATDSALSHSQDLSQRLKPRQQKLTELEARRFTPMPEAAPDRSLEPEALALAAEALADTQAMGEVLIPLFRARRQQHDGHDAEADHLMTIALDRARAQGRAGRSSLVLVLQALGRYDEAQAVVRELVAEAPDEDPTFHLSLWTQARSYENAAPIVASLRATRPTARWQDLTAWGSVLAAVNDLHGASDVLGRARDAFEKRMARLTRDAFRVSITDDAQARDLYTLSADVARRSGRTEEAFELTDRLRSLALDALLDDVSARTQQTPERSAVLRGWSRASAAWTGAFDLVAAAGHEAHPDRLEPARRRLEQAQFDLESAERDLEQLMPGRLLRHQRPSAPLRLAEVQSLLPEDTALVEYLAGWDRILIWAVTQRQALVREQRAETPRVSGAVRRFHGACARLRPATGGEDAAWLSELLLGPVSTVLRDHARIIVVPSGPLHLVPFHALPFESDVLGARHVVSTLPSGSVLRHVTGRSRPDLARGALVVGDPSYEPARNLRRLPGTRVEARRVAASYGVTALLDDDATGERVSHEAAGASVIHLATHGQVSAAAPTLSSVALAGADELTVADLMGLAMDADLVVLSACDTGRGDTTLGGDLVGLARGLLAAGARNTVVSLWPVDDTATCVLMENFAVRIAGGSCVAEALTGARRDLRSMDEATRTAAFSELSTTTGPEATSSRRRTTRDTLLDTVPEYPNGDHPYWWAPFIHVGV